MFFRRELSASKPLGPHLGVPGNICPKEIHKHKNILSSKIRRWVTGRKQKKSQFRSKFWNLFVAFPRLWYHVEVGGRRAPPILLRYLARVFYSSHAYSAADANYRHWYFFSYFEWIFTFPRNCGKLPLWAGGSGMGTQAHATKLFPGSFRLASKKLMGSCVMGFVWHRRNIYVKAVISMEYICNIFVQSLSRINIPVILSLWRL